MNIRKIIKEEINDFDWADDIPIKAELKVGEKLYLDGTSIEDEWDMVLEWPKNGYMVLQIIDIDIDNDTVEYKTVDTNMDGEHVGDVDWTNLDNAQHLIDTLYWQSLVDQLK